jgi:hypothetical protein
MSEANKAKFTKGPWQWLVNKESKKVELCGKGIEVLRFKRYGMQGAAPTFTEDHMGHMLQGVKAEDLAVDITGREHHAGWCQKIDHPDAHLIAAAPDLYEEIQKDIIHLTNRIILSICPETIKRLEVERDRKCYLLAKARGE